MHRCIRLRDCVLSLSTVTIDKEWSIRFMSKRWIQYNSVGRRLRRNPSQLYYLITKLEDLLGGIHIITPAYLDEPYEIMTEYHSRHSAHWGVKRIISLIKLYRPDTCEDWLSWRRAVREFVHSRTLWLEAAPDPACHCSYSLCAVIPVPDDENRHGHYRFTAGGHQRK